MLFCLFRLPFIFPSTTLHSIGQDPLSAPHPSTALFRPQSLPNICITISSPPRPCEPLFNGNDLASPVCALDARSITLHPCLPIGAVPFPCNSGAAREVTLLLHRTNLNPLCQQFTHPNLSSAMVRLFRPAAERRTLSSPSPNAFYVPQNDATGADLQELRRNLGCVLEVFPVRSYPLVSLPGIQQVVVAGAPRLN